MRLGIRLKSVSDSVSLSEAKSVSDSDSEALNQELDCRNHMEQDFTCCNIQCMFCTKFILCE